MALGLSLLLSNFRTCSVEAEDTEMSVLDELSKALSDKIGFCFLSSQNVIAFNFFSGSPKAKNRDLSQLLGLKPRFVGEFVKPRRF